jgi:hypothetical protein
MRRQPGNRQAGLRGSIRQDKATAAGNFHFHDSGNFDVSDLPGIHESSGFFELAASHIRLDGGNGAGYLESGTFGENPWD